MVHPFPRRIEEVLRLYLHRAASSNRSGIEEDVAELVRWARPRPGLLPAPILASYWLVELAAAATKPKPAHATAVDLTVVAGPSQKDAKKKEKRDRERTQQESLRDLVVVVGPSHRRCSTTERGCAIESSGRMGRPCAAPFVGHELPRVQEWVAE
jgi:hypothetical protein